MDFGYDNIGNLNSVNRYSDLSCSQLVRVTTYTYDANNRLDVLSHGSGVSYDFYYDNANRITKIADIDLVTNYTYDKNNQLTAADHSNSNKPDESFSYDANGNGTNSGYQTGSNNRLQSDGTFNYAYDDEGNLIHRTEIASNQVTEYKWDYRNRFAGVFDNNATGNITQEVGFKYDAMNRRISKKVGSTETGFVYDRDNVLFDFVASGSNQPVLDKRYFYGTGVDQVLAQESAQGSVLWALTDQLRTVADWVDSSGSVANHHVVYDLFGGVVSQSNSAAGSRYGFTGRELDAETGLYYYRSRYYNAGIGRFIGEDSVGFDGGDANLYRYVENSPVDSTDPLGQYGLVIDLVRRISYNVGTETKTANDIKEVEKDVDKNPSNVLIKSDETMAVIEHSGSRTGTDTNRKNRQSVLGIWPADHQGHIVSGALGGTGALNNVFAQNGWVNSNSNSLWHQFELLVDPTLTRMERNKCLTEVTLFYQVSLKYEQHTAPRITPTLLTARATFFPSNASLLYAISQI